MNFSGLLERQHEPYARIVKSLQVHGAALDASDMGTGKTYTACAAIREFGLPSLVVCPKVIVGAWHRVAAEMGTETEAINYEMVRTGRTPFGCWDARGKFEWSPAIKFLVFDEVHRCGGLKTDNRAMVLAAKRQGIKTLAMSGTPAQSPLEMDALGYLLGLHEPARPVTLRTLQKGPGLPHFYQWIRRHGCRPGRFGGFEFGGTAADRAAMMVRIQKEIGDKFVRTSISDIPDFPENQVLADLYDLPERSSAGIFDEIYATIFAAQKELQARMIDDRDPENPLTRILRARQQLELLKAPVLLELGAEALKCGKNLIIFVNFKQTIEALKKHIPFPIVEIHGDNTGEQNLANSDRFKRDEVRVCLAQIDCGGVGIGLQDTRGEFPRYVLVSPGQSATNFRQALCRAPRHGAKSKTLTRVVLINDTIEKNVHRNLVVRLNHLDALTDADLDPQNLPLDTR
jgi:superfamily II DNA or RNA helicase